MRKVKLFQFIETIFLVLIIVLPIRFLLFEPFFVVGESMEPTFHSLDYLIIDKISYRFREPHRSEVIIFRPPVNQSVFYIKRIIGLPNERINIKNGKITIFNKDHPDGFLLRDPDLPNIQTPGEFSVQVKAGTYFVLGDNRDQSYDSRRWGLLPKKDVIGKVAFNLIPLSKVFRLVKSGFTK